MTDHLLGHYWNGTYNAFLENRSDVCNFAKLVDLHFRQRIKLKFDTNLLLFWLMEVTKLRPGHFPFGFEIIETKTTWSGSFKLNSPNSMLQQQRKFPQIPSSTFQRTCSIFFYPNCSPNFRPQSQLLKHGKCLFLDKTSTAGARVLLVKTNSDRVYALDTRFRAYLCIKRLLLFIHVSRRNPTKNWRVC